MGERPPGGRRAAGPAPPPWAVRWPTAASDALSCRGRAWRTCGTPAPNNTQTLLNEDGRASPVCHIGSDGVAGGQPGEGTPTPESLALVSVLLQPLGLRKQGAMRIGNGGPAIRRSWCSISTRLTPWCSPNGRKIFRKYFEFSCLSNNLPSEPKERCPMTEVWTEGKRFGDTTQGGECSDKRGSRRACLCSVIILILPYRVSIVKFGSASGGPLFGPHLCVFTVGSVSNPRLKKRANTDAETAPRQPAPWPAAGRRNDGGIAREPPARGSLAPRGPGQVRQLPGPARVGRGGHGGERLDEGDLAGLRLAQRLRRRPRRGSGAEGLVLALRGHDGLFWTNPFVHIKYKVWKGWVNVAKSTIRKPDSQGDQRPKELWLVTEQPSTFAT